MTFKNLFRTKHHSDQHNELKRVLGAFDLTLLGIGAIIGTGIFVLTGIAAATQAGPAVVIAFIVSGVACAFAALSYAELAASVGGCGSAYGYSYAAFGELIAWIIGWDLVLEYGVSVAAVANGWSGYFNTGLKAISFPLPDILTKGPTLIFTNTEIYDVLSGATKHSRVFSIDFTNGIVNLPAMAIILILMAMLIVGVKESARLNAGMVFIKLLTICVFVGVAIFHINPANWHPFAPFGWFSYTSDGKTVGILAAASLVFFAYVGFDAVSTAVEEARDPQRTVPIGILASLGFCTVIYIIVSGLLTAIVPYKDLNVSSPVAHALEILGINWASALVATGVITGLTTVMLVLYYGLTRILLAMSRDGLISPWFSTVNSKTHTPVHNTVICGIVIAILAGFIPLGLLAELVNIGTLAAFVLVCGGVIMLRIKHPDMKRPFKAPGGLLIPILGVLSCAALIGFLPLMTHLRFVIWLAVGIVIYFAYSARHSKLAAGMIESAVAALVALINTLGYFGIFIAAIAQGAFIPIPSELTLIPAGYLVYQDQMSFPIVYAIAIFGSALGSFLNYFIAWKWGRGIFIRHQKLFMMNEERLAKMEGFFRRHGSFSIFIGRIMYGVRHYISFPAGLVHMDVKKFAIFTVAGDAIWCAILLGIGYIMGGSQNEIKVLMPEIKLGMLVAVIAAITIYVLNHRRKRVRSSS